MLHAYDVLYHTLENTGHAPKLNIMDNKAPGALKQLLKKGESGTTISTAYLQNKRSGTCYMGI